MLKMKTKKQIERDYKKLKKEYDDLLDIHVTLIKRIYKVILDLENLKSYASKVEYLNNSFLNILSFCNPKYMTKNIKEKLIMHGLLNRKYLLMV